MCVATLTCRLRPSGQLQWSPTATEKTHDVDRHGFTWLYKVQSRAKPSTEKCDSVELLLLSSSSTCCRAADKTWTDLLLLQTASSTVTIQSQRHLLAAGGQGGAEEKMMISSMFEDYAVLPGSGFCVGIMGQSDCYSSLILQTDGRLHSALLLLFFCFFFSQLLENSLACNDRHYIPFKDESHRQKMFFYSF